MSFYSTSHPVTERLTLIPEKIKSRSSNHNRDAKLVCDISLDPVSKTRSRIMLDLTEDNPRCGGEMEENTKNDTLRDSSPRTSSLVFCNGKLTPHYSDICIDNSNKDKDRHKDVVVDLCAETEEQEQKGRVSKRKRENAFRNHKVVDAFSEDETSPLLIHSSSFSSSSSNAKEASHRLLLDISQDLDCVDDEYEFNDWASEDAKRSRDGDSTHRSSSSNIMTEPHLPGDVASVKTPNGELQKDSHSDANNYRKRMKEIRKNSSTEDFIFPWRDPLERYPLTYPGLTTFFEKYERHLDLAYSSLPLDAHKIANGLGFNCSETDSDAAPQKPQTSNNRFPSSSRAYLVDDMGLPNKQARTASFPKRWDKILGKGATVALPSAITVEKYRSKKRKPFTSQERKSVHESFNWNNSTPIFPVKMANKRQNSWKDDCSKVESCFDEILTLQSSAGDFGESETKEEEEEEKDNESKLRIYERFEKVDHICDTNPSYSMTRNLLHSHSVNPSPQVVTSINIDLFDEEEEEEREGKQKWESNNIKENNMLQEKINKSRKRVIGGRDVAIDKVPDSATKGGGSSSNGWIHVKRQRKDVEEKDASNRSKNAADQREKESADSFAKTMAMVHEKVAMQEKQRNKEAMEQRFATAKKSLDCATRHMFPHQKFGLQWMKRREDEPFRQVRGGMLCDEMGLGKTLALIALIGEYKAKGEESAPTLVAAPKSLLAQWEKEIAHFSDGKLRVLRVEDGKCGNSIKEAALARYDVILTTPTRIASAFRRLIHRRFNEELSPLLRSRLPKCIVDEEERVLFRRMLESTYDHSARHTEPAVPESKKDQRAAVWFATSWFRVICDEAHEILGNPASQSSCSLRSLTAHRRWFVSGTPVRSCHSNVLSAMAFLHLDSPHVRTRHAWYAFIRTHCPEGDKEAVKSGGALLDSVPIEIPEITEWFSHLMLRRTKSSISLSEDVHRSRIEPLPASPPECDLRRGPVSLRGNEDSERTTAPSCGTSERERRDASLRSGLDRAEETIVRLPLISALEQTWYEAFRKEATTSWKASSHSAHSLPAPPAEKFKSAKVLQLVTCLRQLCVMPYLVSEKYSAMKKRAYESAKAFSPRIRMLDGKGAEKNSRSSHKDGKEMSRNQDVGDYVPTTLIHVEDETSPKIPSLLALCSRFLILHADPKTRYQRFYRNEVKEGGGEEEETKKHFRYQNRPRSGTNDGAKNHQDMSQDAKNNASIVQDTRRFSSTQAGVKMGIDTKESNIFEEKEEEEEEEECYYEKIEGNSAIGIIQEELGDTVANIVSRCMFENPEIFPLFICAKTRYILNYAEKVRACKEKVLVFCEWTQPLFLMSDLLRARGFRARVLHGKMTGWQRQDLVSECFLPTGPELLFCSMRLGCGLNMTFANHFLQISPVWNETMADQARARIERIGQTRPVKVIRLMIGGSIEERVHSIAMARKKHTDILLAGTVRSHSAMDSIPDHSMLKLLMESLDDSDSLQRGQK